MKDGCRICRRAQVVKLKSFVICLKTENKNCTKDAQSTQSYLFLVKLYHIKCMCGMSDKALSMIIELLQDAFEHAKIPKSLYEAKKIIRKLGLDYQKIDACPNDCMLYWGPDKSLNECKRCGTSRWKNSSTECGHGLVKKKKQQLAKILRYFPLIPRLQKLFMSSKTSADMKWHAVNNSKDGFLRHPRDGKAWKNFDTKFSEFASDARNVRLALASDGFNPFGNMSTSYSIWPVVLIPYNRPPWICMKQTNFILSMIIPGKKMPGNDIDIYLQPLVDELKELWDGVETFDAYSNETFKMRAALMWTISDFPGLGTLSGWNTYDADGTTKEARYMVQDVWYGRKIIVSSNECGQVVGDAGGLLGGFLGVLGSDFSKFPICYVSWHKVPQKYKDKVYNDIIQKKFHILDNQVKCDIMKRIGKTWKDTRCSLFHEFFDSNLSLEENVAKHLAGIDEDHWRWFLEYRLKDKTKEMCLKNVENRKKQLYTHTGGSKSIARRKDEEERQRGRSISRGELWVMLHKKMDGSYINDDAQVIGEKIVSIEQEDESLKVISQNDSLSQALGKEQSGRVRGMSYGPCPTRVTGQTSHSPAPVNPRLQTNMNAMKSELEASRLKMQNLEQVIEIERLRRQAYEGAVKYMLQMQGINLPPDLATLLNAVPSDEGSPIEPKSPGVRPSSSAASHDAQHDHTNQSGK